VTSNWAETAQASFVGGGYNAGKTYTVSVYLWSAGNTTVSCQLTISDVNYNSTYSVILILMINPEDTRLHQVGQLVGGLYMGLK
jgi:hypothetical protein